MFSCGSSSWWSWNLGFMSGLALCIQVFSGVGLALGYQDVSAHFHIEDAERHIGIWSWRRAHSTGATIYFLAMINHIARSILSSSLASSTSWSGIVIYFLSLVVALLGYSLTEGNMAQWGMTVVTSAFLSLPAGEFILPVIVGDYGISSLILPRVYALHFLLGLISPIAVMWHSIEVHSNESSTELGTRIGPSGKDFASGGGTKDLLVTALTTILLLKGFDDTSILWRLIEDMNANDWPQQNKTPEPIGPEWYVLPYFASLKLTNIYAIMAALVIIIGAYLLQGAPWTFLGIILGWSCFILGKLALTAHESLEEVYVISFILLWTSWTCWSYRRES
uniref:Cytochrome b n=1 Tax=Kudoa hexapunctata TaxID=1450334 RepID=A0A0H5AY16_9CNID|nr:cytochrome b [Kudoa hexapunctata]BAR94698.1 cytochrome b [Kudoa hexapunctata]